MTVVLGIDTSQTRPAMALVRDEETLAAVAAEAWPVALPALLAGALSAAAGPPPVSLDDVAVVAVATGPGRYTSLRSGVAFAKGIASARPLRLLGVPTAAAISLAAMRPAAVMIVPAGRGRYYVSVSAADLEPKPASVVEIARRVTARPIAGHIDAETRRRLAEAGLECVDVSPEACAIAVAHLANRHLRGDHGAVSSDVTPRYAAPATTERSPDLPA